MEFGYFRRNLGQVGVILGCIRNASGVGLFPGSSPQVVGSTFDAFVSALLAHPTAAANLPVVTSEIGDTCTPHIHHEPTIDDCMLRCSPCGRV